MNHDAHHMQLYMHEQGICVLATPTANNKLNSCWIYIHMEALLCTCYVYRYVCVCLCMVSKSLCGCFPDRPVCFQFAFCSVRKETVVGCTLLQSANQVISLMIWFAFQFPHLFVFSVLEVEDFSFSG